MKEGLNLFGIRLPHGIFGGGCLWGWRGRLLRRNGWDDARMAIDVKIEQLWIPDSLDTPDAADFLAAVEVGRKVRMQTWGSDDLAYGPLEKLLEFADPYERQLILVAKVDGDIVGTWRARAVRKRLELSVTPWTSVSIPLIEREAETVAAVRGLGAVDVLS